MTSSPASVSDPALSRPGDLPSEPARVLSALFGADWEVAVQGRFLRGEGRADGETVAVLGTCGHAAIGADLALALAGGGLSILRHHPGRPILLLVDNSGQKLSRRDELLGNNSYLAHLAKCLAVARARGHRTLALVYSEAVSGGFLATGMSAGPCYALPGVELRVMGLEAMSKVTLIPLDRLSALCRTMPTLAPGVENFVRMGVIREIWNDPADGLRQALAAPPEAPDRQRRLGLARGGRPAAAEVAERVRRAPGG